MIEPADHEYAESEYGKKSGRRIRTEGGTSKGAKYFISGHDPDLCAGAVYGGWRHHQCQRNNPKYEHRGVLFCGTHYPPKVHERNLARQAKSDREYAERRRRREASERRERLRDKAVEALRDIARGNNDPRGLAEMILTEYDDEWPKEQ